MQDEAEQVTLRAVLFADLEQYSRLVATNEPETLEYLDICFDVFRSLCRDFGAEFIKTTGDGVLILFDSASNAVEYAITVQRRLESRARAFRDLGHFRIGLHMGEVRLRDGDVFGHAVNLAARVQTQAHAGGVCVTQDVFRAARQSTRYGFQFAGRPALKNMPNPVSLYHVLP